MGYLAQACIEIGCGGICYAAWRTERRFCTGEEFSVSIGPFDIRILAAIREAKFDIFLHIWRLKPRYTLIILSGRTTFHPNTSWLLP